MISLLISLLGEMVARRPIYSSKNIANQSAPPIEYIVAECKDDESVSIDVR